MAPIRNTVISRLFGVYTHKKIYLELSHYAKKPSGMKNGRLFCVDSREGGETTTSMYFCEV